MASAPLISPSLMCADQAALGEAVRALEAGGADMLHIDVMDGDFVPNLTFGPGTIRALRPLTRLPFDVHLMVRRPERHIDAFVSAGSDIVTVHAEATDHLHRTLVQIRQAGARAGVALNPSTPLSAIRYVLDAVDLVLIMTVDPGFAGQPFIAAVLPKIQALTRLVRRHQLPIQIAVDGHIGPDTIPACLRAGANILVCGTSSIFRPGADIAETTRNLKASLTTLR